MASIKTNTKKKWLITSIICIVLLLLSAALYYIHFRVKTYNNMYNSIMDPLFQMVLNESIFIYAITMLGYTALMFMNRFVRNDIAIVMSLVTGSMMWAMMSKVVICTGLRFTPLYIILACVAFLVVLFFVAKPDKTKLKQMYLENANIRLVLLCLSILFSMFFYYAFSYDSYIYVALGEKLVKVGYLTRDMMKYVSGFSLFTSLFFAPSELFGFDFAIGYYTYTCVSFVIAVAYIAYTEVIDRVGRAKAILIGICSFLAVVTANIFFMLMYLPLSNIIAGCSMFFMIYFIYRSNQNNKSIADLLISLFFAICFIWTRSENGLYVLMIVFILTQLKFDKKYIALYTGTCFGAIGFWYMRFFLVAGRFSEGDFLTIDKALLVLGAYAVMLVYVLLIDQKFIANNQRIIKKAYYIGIALCLAGLVLLDLDKAGVNLEVTIANLFRTGGWGPTMVFVILAMIIYYYYVDRRDVFDTALINFVLFYMLIYMLRGHPLRIGYGDSGNRYLIYLIPYLVFMISTRLVPLLNRGQTLSKEE